MFVGLFISLVSVESSSIIRTPLLVSSTNKKAYYFEVQDNKVIDFVTNWAIVERELEKLSLQACEEPHLSSGITKDNAQYHIAEVEKYLAQFEEFENCIDENRRKLKDFRVTTPDYNVSTVPNSLDLIYQPLQMNSGTILEKSKQDYPQVKRKLDQLDPEVRYIVFLVKPDSFAEFRQARELAWDMGFDVGWEPFTEDLVFSPSIFSGLGETIKILPQ